jgi:hypothetical protein
MIIRLTTFCKKVNTNATFTLRSYLNTVDAIGGTQLTTTSSTNTLHRQLGSIRDFRIVSATRTDCVSPTISYTTDMISASIYSELNLDYTVNQKIVFSLQNGSASDETYITLVLIEVL